MNIAFKIFGVLALLAIIGVATVMIVMDRMHAKSRRQITQIVSEIRPGMPFHAVASRLGRANETLTNSADIAVRGTTKDDKIVTNTVLNLFVHNAIPFRWICVYTDRDSNVVYASWKDM